MKYEGMIKCTCGFEFHIESENDKTSCLMCGKNINIPKSIRSDKPPDSTEQ